MKLRKYRTWAIARKAQPFDDHNLFFTPSGTKREAQLFLRNDLDFNTTEFEVVRVEITELRGGE